MNMTNLPTCGQVERWNDSTLSKALGGLPSPCTLGQVREALQRVFLGGWHWHFTFENCPYDSPGTCDVTIRPTGIGALTGFRCSIVPDEAMLAEAEKCVRDYEDSFRSGSSEEAAVV